jgi:hydroxypyruvate isomerase
VNRRAAQWKMPMILSANLSFMFTEVPLLERFALARAAGFDCVEIQFPYEHSPQALKAAADGLPIDLINVPAGAPERGYLGLATDIAQKAGFEAAVETALDYAGVLGVKKLNVLCGAPPAGQGDKATRAHVAANLRHAAGRMAEAGILCLAEMINPFDSPGFWLSSLARGIEALRDTEHPNLKLQFDLYHMARTEPDLVAAIAQAAPHIGHVQFADAPGRHEPGAGEIDFATALRALGKAGYHGIVAAEYRPLGETLAGLAWMQGWRDLAANARPNTPEI